MKKIILTLLLVGSTLFANDVTVSTEQNTTSSQTEEAAPKSGFDAMTPLGKTAFVVAAPVFIAGGILTIGTQMAIEAPFKTLSWIGDKITEATK